MKIHRDLLLAPKNRSEELAALPEPLAAVLRALLGGFTPIVLGYGGNDGSLMNFLNAMQPGEIPGGIYWCYWGRGGPPGDTTLERWTSKCDEPALDGDGTRLTGAVHRVEVTRYAQSCALEVHLGSAPLTALEELVRELRPFGEVSFDRAALEAVGTRSHGGTKEDIVPLVRREGGTLSEHLVGEFWIQYAVESRQG